MTPNEFHALPENIPYRVSFRSRTSDRQALGWLTIKNGSGIVHYDDQTFANITKNAVDSIAVWLSMLHLVGDSDSPDSGNRTVEIKVSVTIPPNCEATGEFRQPDPAVDSYLHQDGVTVIHPSKGHVAPTGPRIILKRKKLTAKERLEELRITASSLPVIRMEIDEILKLM